jgi:hypothetical protein
VKPQEPGGERSKDGIWDRRQALVHGGEFTRRIRVPIEESLWTLIGE